MSGIDAINGSLNSNYLKIADNKNGNQKKADIAQPKVVQAYSSMPMYAAVGVPIIQAAPQKADAPKTQPKDGQKKNAQHDAKQTFSSSSNSNKKYTPMYLSGIPLMAPATKTSFWSKVGSLLSAVNREIGLDITPAQTLATIPANPPQDLQNVDVYVPSASLVKVSFLHAVNAPGNDSNGDPVDFSVTKYQVIFINTSTFTNVNSTVASINSGSVNVDATEGITTKYVNADQSIQADPAGNYLLQFAVPGDLSAGTYRVAVRAENAQGQWGTIGANSVNAAAFTLSAPPAPPSSVTISNVAYSDVAGAGTLTVTHTLSNAADGAPITSYQAIIKSKSSVDASYGSLTAFAAAFNNKVPAALSPAASSNWVNSTGTINITGFDASMVASGDYYVIVVGRDGQGNLSPITTSLIKTVTVSWQPNPVTVTSATATRITGTSDYNVIANFNTTTDQDPGSNITGYKMGMVDVSNYADIPAFIAAFNSHPENIKWDAGTADWTAVPGTTGSLSLPDQALTAGHSYYTFVIAQDNNQKTSQLTASSVVTVLAGGNQTPLPVTVTNATATKTANGYSITVTHNLTTDPDGTITGYKAVMLKAGLVGAGKKYATQQDLLDAINGVQGSTQLAQTDYVGGTIDFIASTGTITITTGALAEGTDYKVYVLAQDNDGKSSLVAANSIKSVNISTTVNQLPLPVTVTSATATKTTAGYDVTVTHNLTTDPDGTITGYKAVMLKPGLVGAGKKYATQQDLLAAINGLNVTNPLVQTDYIAGTNFDASTGTITIPITWTLAEGDYTVYVVAQDNGGATSLVNAGSVKSVTIAIAGNQAPLPVAVTKATVTKTTSGGNDTFNITVTHNLTTDPDGPADKIKYKAIVLKPGVLGSTRYPTKAALENAINGVTGSTPLVGGDGGDYFDGNQDFIASTGSIALPPVTWGMPDGPYTVYVVAEDEQGKISLVNDNSLTIVQVGNPPVSPASYGFYSNFANVATGSKNSATFYTGENYFQMVIPNAAFDAKKQLTIQIYDLAQRLVKKVTVDLSAPSLATTNVNGTAKAIKIAWDQKNDSGSQLAAGPYVVLILEGNLKKAQVNILLRKTARPGGSAQ